MGQLNDELTIIEIKMHDDYDTDILKLDTLNVSLMSKNTKLMEQIKLLETFKDKYNRLYQKNIQKDKYIYELQNTIQTKLIDFNKEMLPKSYIRISKSFHT